MNPQKNIRQPCICDIPAFEFMVLPNGAGMPAVNDTTSK